MKESVNKKENDINYSILLEFYDCMIEILNILYANSKDTGEKKGIGKVQEMLFKLMDNVWCQHN